MNAPSFLLRTLKSRMVRPRASRFVILGIILAILASFSFTSLRAQSDYSTPYTISTLAGSVDRGSVDGTAAAARFAYPTGIAVDASGNVFVADFSNDKIRKISPAGVVTTLAGSGTSGSADGTGAAASFHNPSGVAVDAGGNVFVADSSNCKIRKGTLSTSNLTELTLSNNSISRRAGAGAVVGALSVTNPGGSNFTYTLVPGAGSTDNVYFSISGNQLIVKIPINFVAGIYSVRVNAADGSGNVISKVFLITFYDELGDGLKVTSASAGSLFTKENGSLWAMGWNAAGEIGDGTTITRINPVKVVASGVRAVASGTTTNYFIKEDNTLWAMGSNGGLYGNGTTAESHVPIQIATNVTSVSAGPNITFFIKTDGTLWEATSSPVPGNPNPNDHFTARQIASGVRSASAGTNFGTFVKNDSTAWAYGQNFSGQIGDGSKEWRNTPVQVATGVLATSCGTSHTVLLMENGTILTAGLNTNGQLGDGTNTSRSTLAPIPGITDAVAAQGGGNCTVFIRSDRSLWGVGRDEYARLGNGGNTLDKLTPVWTAGNVAQFSAGSISTLFIKTDGTLWGIGNNQDGVLGDGSTQYRPAPVLIVGAPPLSDASLSNIIPSVGFLDPAVTPTVTEYSSFVPYGTTSMFVTPVSSDPLATIRVNGVRVPSGSPASPVIPGSGWNTLARIVVTAQSGATRSYEYKVYRATTSGAAPVMTSAATASGTLGSPFSFKLTANQPGYFSLISGPLPPGLSLNIETGVISGTPAIEGTFRTEVAVYWTTGAAKSVLTFTISRLGQSMQTITFPAISDRTATNASLTLSATASSGLPVSFKLISGPATLSGRTVTLTGAAGTVEVRASQAGNATYAPATPVERSFVVTAASSVSTLSKLAVQGATLSPKFASSTRSYTTKVANSTKSIKLTPTAKSTKAKIAINGVTVKSGTISKAIALKIGTNVISVVVTAQNGSKRTYAIAVTRAAAASPTHSAPLRLASTGLAQTSGLATAQAGMVTSVERIDGLKYLAIEIHPPAGPATSRPRVEVSPNLIDWYSGNAHTTVVEDCATRLRVRDNTPVMPDRKRYIRVIPSIN